MQVKLAGWVIVWVESFIVTGEDMKVHELSNKTDDSYMDRYVNFRLNDTAYTRYYI